MRCRLECFVFLYNTTQIQVTNKWHHATPLTWIMSYLVYTDTNHSSQQCMHGHFLFYCDNEAINSNETGVYEQQCQNVMVLRVILSSPTTRVWQTWPISNKIAHKMVILGHSLSARVLFWPISRSKDMKSPYPRVWFWKPASGQFWYIVILWHVYMEYKTKLMALHVLLDWTVSGFALSCHPFQGFGDYRGTNWAGCQKVLMFVFV